jgi:hypothetical protein
MHAPGRRFALPRGPMTMPDKTITVYTLRDDTTTFAAQELWQVWA